MCASCSSRLQAHARSPRDTRGEGGFTLPELIAVILLIAILSATALPKMQGALSFREDAYRDEAVAALRHAHKTALSHRRLVCASVASGSVSLSIASTNPASACSTALNGPDGTANTADSRGAVTSTVTPSSTLYFQPSGRVTTDGAGVNAGQWSITVAALAAITVVGETGHVR